MATSTLSLWTMPLSSTTPPALAMLTLTHFLATTVATFCLMAIWWRRLMMRSPPSTTVEAWRAPSHLDTTSAARLCSKAKCFLLSSGRLWHLQDHGCHQLYILPEQCLGLIHDAHNHLGHYRFYATCHTLLDRFWWPSLESDVRWYVQTCHQCQL